MAPLGPVLPPEPIMAKRTLKFWKTFTSQRKAVDPGPTTPYRPATPPLLTAHAISCLKTCPNSG